MIFQLLISEINPPKVHSFGSYRLSSKKTRWIKENVKQKNRTKWQKQYYTLPKRRAITIQNSLYRQERLFLRVIQVFFGFNSWTFVQELTDD